MYCMINYTWKCGGGGCDDDDDDDDDDDSSVRSGITNQVSCNQNITNRNTLQMLAVTMRW
jgi:hypothetical protein